MTDPAIILAAGEASRFGRPKQLAKFQGRPLLAHAVATVRAAGLRPVVVLGAHREEVESVLDDDCRRVVAPNWRAGMGASLRSGVRALESTDFDRLLLMTCDQPLVTADDVRKLYEACEGVDAAAAAYEGVVGVPACFDARHADRLANLDDDVGARRLLRDADLDVREVPMPRAATDIDTPSDIADIEPVDRNGGAA